MRLIELCPTPQVIVWDITYACPLRCAHCYSESGRRPSRQLGYSDLFRVTDALISTKPSTVVLSGGEPLVVREVFAVAERMLNAGVEVILYTSGWGFVPSMLPAIVSLFSRVAVSVDGATAEVHDRIRGRVGSFHRAMDTLAQLDRTMGDLRRRDERTPQLGIEYAVMQSNCHQLREFCVNVAPKFQELSSVAFGAVLPSGLGSRPSFAEQELLSEEQASLLSGGELAQELQSLAPTWVEVSTTDNRRFQMHPDLLGEMHILPMQVEPDGRVRAMPPYEGTVGSLLDEELPVLWERAMEQWSDPFVIETLTPATTMMAWAEATRRIDNHFGSADVRERIARRPPYTRD